VPDSPDARPACPAETPSPYGLDRPRPNPEQSHAHSAESHKSGGSEYSPRWLSVSGRSPPPTSSASSNQNSSYRTPESDRLSARSDDDARTNTTTRPTYRSAKPRESLHSPVAQRPRRTATPQHLSAYLIAPYAAPPSQYPPHQPDRRSPSCPLTRPASPAPA